MRRDLNGTWRLIYNNYRKFGFWDRILFLIYGEIKLRIWKDDNESVKFCIQTRKLNGSWDGQ